MGSVFCFQGNEYQRSRFDCDARFLEDMTSACRRKTSLVELPLCLLFSVSFYTIVRAVSENYFIYDNSAHCLAPWVKPCITCYYSQRWYMYNFVDHGILQFMFTGVFFPKILPIQCFSIIWKSCFLNKGVQLLQNAWVMDSHVWFLTRDVLMAEYTNII